MSSFLPSFHDGKLAIGYLTIEGRIMEREYPLKNPRRRRGPCISPSIQEEENPRGSYAREGFPRRGISTATIESVEFGAIVFVYKRKAALLTLGLLSLTAVENPVLASWISLVLVTGTVLVP
ncbi:UNVERIFIED_CONTAM: hypothetical protein Slati_4521700 [Sesamum latifolium]|uniref:Uncharacterized protein n=1 Tax=Sesamum latifolium TaxID=2727402 RepID=A0AAW2SHJ2_9LAMI